MFHANMRLNIKGLHLAFLVTTGACATAAKPELPQNPSRIVPALPPDTIPEGMYADSNITDSSKYASVPHLTNVSTVVFRPTATQLERQHAIDLVGGIVIGGARIGDDGIYYVQIPTKDDGEAMASARLTLQGSSQITAALYTIVSFKGDRINP